MRDPDAKTLVNAALAAEMSAALVTFVGRLRFQPGGSALVLCRRERTLVRLTAPDRARFLDEDLVEVTFRLGEAGPVGDHVRDELALGPGWVVRRPEGARVARVPEPRCPACSGAGP